MLRKKRYKRGDGTNSANDYDDHRQPEIEAFYPQLVASLCSFARRLEQKRRWTGVVGIEKTRRPSILQEGLRHFFYRCLVRAQFVPNSHVADHAGGLTEDFADKRPGSKTVSLVATQRMAAGPSPDFWVPCRQKVAIDTTSLVWF